MEVMFKVATIAMVVPEISTDICLFPGIWCKLTDQASGKFVPTVLTAVLMLDD